MYHSKISGLGYYVPENVVTNDHLAKIMETNDEWIQERTGIKERRHVIKGDGDTTTTMGVKAAKIAAKEIADIYKASTPQAKVSVKPELEKGNTGGKEAFEYISRLDWVAQRNKILSSNRGNEGHPDIIKLDKRREKSMRQE